MLVDLTQLHVQTSVS